MMETIELPCVLIDAKFITPDVELQEFAIHQLHMVMLDAEPEYLCCVLAHFGPSQHAFIFVNSRAALRFASMMENAKSFEEWQEDGS